MELWIRSQSRHNLMKANDIVAQDNEILVYKESEKSTIVGKYVTKERALEVLDEIQSIIKLINAWELDKNSFNVCIKKFGCTEEELVPIMSKMQCYEMPKE